MPEAERDIQQMTHKKESLNSNPSHDSDFPLENFLSLLDLIFQCAHVFIHAHTLTPEKKLSSS